MSLVRLAWIYRERGSSQNPRKFTRNYKGPCFYLRRNSEARVFLYEGFTTNLAYVEFTTNLAYVDFTTKFKGPRFFVTWILRRNELTWILRRIVLVILWFVVKSSLSYEENTRIGFKSLKAETPNPKPLIPSLLLHISQTLLHLNPNPFFLIQTLNYKTQLHNI